MHQRQPSGIRVFELSSVFSLRVSAVGFFAVAPASNLDCVDILRLNRRPASEKVISNESV